jgi:hypothetical protein
MYDIFFISYNEPDADKNWQALKSQFIFAKRIDGVQGIHNAHIKAAVQSLTKMFWVVDADAILVDDFNFSLRVEEWDTNAVHVWYSRNPVNGLEYGYGGVKLFPKNLMLASDTNSIDMTTSISDKFKVIPKVSNITAFNTDPFNTWKSAFRECVKLASKIVTRQNTEESDYRLSVWCEDGLESQYGEYAIAGAIQGRLFAKQHPDKISKINDFDWLYQEYLKADI